MQFDGLFTDQRWNILQHLATQKYSPMELSKITKTTSANISQQLRLLEMARIVKKERVATRDKGKPRMLFSLSNEFFYVVTLMKNRADKRFLNLTEHQRAILSIWLMENTGNRYILEKLYWKLEPFFSKIKVIAVHQGKDLQEVLIVSDDLKELEKKLFFKEFEKVKINFIPEKGLQKYAGLLPLYDPEHILDGKKLTTQVL